MPGPKPLFDDALPVGRIDPDAFLFTGADPCWTPARELKLPDAPDAALGLCSLCGGDAEGGEVPPGSHRVCARCMRYGRERAETAPPPAVQPPRPGVWVVCPDDPGYVERDGVRIPEKYAGKAKG